MASHSWDEVEAVFADAIEFAPGERDALLSQRCAGRPELREEVESLLASHDEAAARFLGVSTGLAPGLDAPIGERLSGRTVGRFRLLEKIGEGGMGVVYLGERVDGDFDERVAIKLIRLPAQPADTLRRFRVERQALATLNHPDIVTLLDGGMTASGEAYLAMKFVEGVPITRYCLERCLGLDERLQLFRRVCAAVQHAHHNGIVHRDLKPSNILVAPDGLPKVLDFGVAKLIDQSGHAVDATGTSLLRPLTPNYASPEQLRGLPVTTACDIYALGVLLYEMLSGAQPYDTAGMPLDELLATVVERVPRRPSTTSADARLPYSTRRLAGDLDAIVLKAMSKEPERRYASAQELSDDCARHLARQPIVAREASLGYYVSRLARRHRPAFVAAAVSVAALVTALGVSLWQTRVAVAERNRAAARFNDVRRLANALIFKIHDQVQPLPGSTPVRHTIVVEALTYLDSLSREPSTDVALQVDLGKAYHRIGSIQGNPSQPNLGDRGAALTSLRRAVALLTPAAGNGAGSRDASLELGRAQLSLSMIANITASPVEAVAAAREAAVLAEHMVGRNPEDDDARRLLGSALFQAALITKGDGAIDRWQRAGDVFTALLARRPGDPDRQRNVALVEKYLGGTYSTANDLPNALSHYTRALELDERRVEANRDNRQAQFDVAVDLTQIAGVHQRGESLAQAAAHEQRALIIFSRLAESDPNDRLARVWVLLSYQEMGGLQEAMGDTDGMLRSAVQAVEIGQSLRAIDALHEVYYGQSLTLLGRAERKAGRAEAACDAFRRSEAVLGGVRESDLSPPSVPNLNGARQTLHEAISGCTR